MIRESEAFKLLQASSCDRDHLSAGRRCRGSNDIMVRIMIAIMMRTVMTMTTTTTGCCSNDTVCLLSLSLLDDADDDDDCSHNCLVDLLVSENMMMMMTHTMEMMMVSKRNKKQVVHHDASDKLFGYNTSSSTWQVPPITTPPHTPFLRHRKVRCVNWCIVCLVVTFVCCVSYMHCMSCLELP